MRFIVMLLAILTFGLSGCGKKGDLAAPPEYSDEEPQEGLLMDSSEDVNRA